MRALIVACAAISLAIACGGSSGGGGGGGGSSQFTLRVASSGNGLVRGAGSDCRGNCSAQYPAGATVHLVAVADSGASFSGWSGACSGSGSCDLTMDADRDVSATFSGAPPPPPPGLHRLTVIVQGKGRVTSTPSGVDCDSTTCYTDFSSGTSVSLTATPASGFGFVGWGAGCSGGAGCTVSLSSDATVYANFTATAPPPPPPQVHLVAAVTGPGTVTGAGLNCGESTTVCDVMVAGGSSVTLTAAPAGGTRFGSWGGACSGSATTCQLTLQADTKVTAEFLSEVLVLAANDFTNIAVLALNSTQVFWPRSTSGGTGIWSVSKKGGTATRVSSGWASAIVTDDSYLYWTDGTSLYSTPVGGGEIALLFSSYPIGRLALDETGALYWTVGSTRGLNTGSVHRMAGRVDKVLANGVQPLGAIAVDGSNVYFTDYGTTGAIRRVPRDGGAVENVISCGTDCVPQAVRLDPQFVYYRLNSSSTISASGAVYAASKSDFSKVATLSKGNGSGGYQYNSDVDVNAGVAYWNWNGGQSPFGIFRANADGSGFAAVDSSNDSSWAALRVDDAAVYYWHSGAIIRRLK
jgi:List-Bact-rpt repeat protein